MDKWKELGLERRHRPGSLSDENKLCLFSSPWRSRVDWENESRPNPVFCSQPVNIGYNWMLVRFSAYCLDLWYRPLAYWLALCAESGTIILVFLIPKTQDMDQDSKFPLWALRIILIYLLWVTLTQRM